MGEEAEDCAGNVGWGRLYTIRGGAGSALDDAQVSDEGVKFSLSPVKTQELTRLPILQLALFYSKYSCLSEVFNHSGSSRTFWVTFPFSMVSTC